ncbi:MAG: CatA-like O-acetyltransferase [Pyrinomonadaceae bacterium]|nr:CatA-like O-acetyltransferase [Pyrinomonadaceae bacterium]
MADYLDVTKWARRDLFQFFLHFDNPYFNVCTSVDVTRLVELLRSRPEISVTLTYHYFALRAANEIEPFRYRLREGKVLIHEAINGGTIVLLPNESFNFAYFDYYQDFEEFISKAQQTTNEVQKGDGVLSPKEADNAIHFTTLPWVSFTSFAHARNWGREDSVPKIAFGKFLKEHDRIRLPISVEVHHALMDGLHVGRFLTRFEELLSKPETSITF